MTQQTTVEKIENYMIENFHLTEEALYELKQAKEMEKQQILAAFEEGANDGYYGEGSSNKEKYYNETYGKKYQRENKKIPPPPPPPPNRLLKEGKEPPKPIKS
jgi:hypothetical protein